MKRNLTAFSAAVLVGLTGIGAAAMVAPAVARPAAALQTKTFAIQNMTCATCPIAVKTAMSRVAGVKRVSVDFESKTATVTYDASLAMPAKIAAASTNVGYPAQVRKST